MKMFIDFVDTFSFFIIFEIFVEIESSYKFLGILVFDLGLTSVDIFAKNSNPKLNTLDFNDSLFWLPYKF